MVASFSLERVQKAPASFDPAKLLAFQTQYMQQVPLDEKVRRVRPFLDARGDRGRRRDACSAHRRGARRSHQGVRRHPRAGRRIFFGDEVPAWDDKAFAKRVMAPGAVDKLRRLSRVAGRRRRERVRRGDARRWSDAKRGSRRRGWALGDIVHAVRVAVTGVGGGPGLFDCLALLGRDRCLARIDRALQKAATT